MKSFSEWLKNRTDETTAFTRKRKAAAQELGPSIPDAEINAHSTAPEWQKEAIVKRNKKHSKKKRHP